MQGDFFFEVKKDSDVEIQADHSSNAGMSLVTQYTQTETTDEGKVICN